MKLDNNTCKNVAVLILFMSLSVFAIVLFCSGFMLFAVVLIVLSVQTGYKHILPHFKDSVVVFSAQTAARLSF